jgi:hypothetical protein
LRHIAAFAIAASAAGPAAAVEGKGELDLIAFFAGRTHAESELKVAFHKPVRHVADSIGKRAPNGDLILVDRIKEEGKPIKERRWVMHKSGPNRFTGTLTDAVSPVDITVSGTAARIRYKMKGGISIEQELRMRDSRTLVNHVSAKRLGIRLGKLDGTIRKLD